MTWSNDGDKHERNCAIGAIAVSGLLYWGSFHTSAFVSFYTILIWGILFSPDLDLSDTGRWNGGGCKAWHRWKRMRLGWYWKPYGHAIKHRSIYSHTLIPGTLIRLLYAGIIPCLFLILAYLKGFDFLLKPLEVKALAEQLDYFKTVARWFILIVGCCFIADSIHLLTDRIDIKKMACLEFFIL